MAAGIQLSATDVNNAVGSVARDLNFNMGRIQSVQSWISTVTDTTLITSYAWTAADCANVRSALNDLSRLQQVYVGATTVTAAYDFRTFAERIWGLGF